MGVLKLLLLLQARAFAVELRAQPSSAPVATPTAGAPPRCCFLLPSQLRFHTMVRSFPIPSCLPLLQFPPPTPSLHLENTYSQFFILGFQCVRVGFVRCMRSLCEFFGICCCIFFLLCVFCPNSCNHFVCLYGG